MNLPRNTCGWSPGLAKTFRNRSSKLWSEYGTNLQNIPDDMRRMYVADEGYLLTQVDQAGAEALIVAYEAPVGNYRALFECGVKVHSWVAMQLFRQYWLTNYKNVDTLHLCTLPIHDLAQHPDWKVLSKIIKESDSWPPKIRFYFIAKMVVHASSYGMRGPTFALNVLQKSRGSVVLTRQQADSFLDHFHDLFPEIRIWHSQVREKILATRTLVNLFGYPRLFTGPFDDTLWKDAYSWVPQSTVGCISNIEFVNEQSYIEDNNLDIDLLNNCHDSTLSQALHNEIMEAAKLKKKLMEQELVSTSGTPFRMKAEASIGKNWGKYSETDNPDGLKEVKL